MKTMSNVDVFAVTHELNKLLKGARVGKAYQPLKDAIILRFHVTGEGRVDVIIQAGVRVHITRYPLKNPKIPPSFPMLLRKHLKGGTLKKVKQYNFDRIIELKIKKEKEYTLIVELFSKGNIILIDENSKIILPLRREIWHDRKILPGEVYRHPTPRGINPLDFEIDQLKTLIQDSNTDIVRTLASNGFGGVYAEEIILRSNVDKKMPAKKLSEKEIESIYKAIKEIFKPLKNLEFTPNIVHDHTEDVLPIELKIYDDHNREYFETYNEAADEFFNKKTREEIKKEHERLWEREIKKYEKRLKIQEESLENFKKTAEKSALKGDLIYSNYKLIENLLKTISKARSKYSHEEIWEKLKNAKDKGIPEAQIIKSLNKKGNLTIKLKGEKITLNINKSLLENAEEYYEKAKKMKKKIEGALNAIQETKKELKRIKEEKESTLKRVTLPEKRVKKKLKWFEKFRWFLSSQGFLVIGGRDAKTNEIIVKRYMDSNDIYLHSDIHGAPSVIIKSEGKRIPEETIKEAAIFAASFSSAWGRGFSHLDVYWVHPQQVTKTPKAGEFVPRGAFVIKGSRNYIRGVPLKLAVGIVNYEGPRIMSGPVSAVKKHSRGYVTLKPGFTKKEAVAKEIMRRVDQEDIITLEDIIRVLPPGKCDII